MHSPDLPAVHLFQAMPSSSCSCCVSACAFTKAFCFPILPTPTTPPTHMLPAVSLPKIAKPELTTIPILGDDNIPAPTIDASAPTKPDEAAPRLSTDKEAAPMEEDHEVISLVASSVIWVACWFVHAPGRIVLPS